VGPDQVDDRSELLDSTQKVAERWFAETRLVIDHADDDVPAMGWASISSINLLARGLAPRINTRSRNWRRR